MDPFKVRSPAWSKDRDAEQEIIQAALELSVHTESFLVDSERYTRDTGIHCFYNLQYIMHKVYSYGYYELLLHFPQEMSAL